MITIQNLLHFFSLLLTALITGLLYGYACSVNPGLNKLPDASYLQAMQSINKEILNPFFFLSFMGTLVMLPLTGWYDYHAQSVASAYFMFAAAAIYLLGVMGITFLGNIPLNENLSKLDIASAGAQELFIQRKFFESGWNRYHLIRTVCSLLSLSLVICSLIKQVKNEIK